MIKLERIYVKNYKNIAEADLELGNMNVIVGENNAGKSNLLSVIPFLNYIINAAQNEINEGFIRGGIFYDFNNVGPLGKLTDDFFPIIIELDFVETSTNITYRYSIAIGRKDIPNLDKPYPSLYIKSEYLSYKEKTKTGKAKEIFNRIGNNITYGGGLSKKLMPFGFIDDNTSVIRIFNVISINALLPKSYISAIRNLNRLLSSPVFYFSPHLLKDREYDVKNNIRISKYGLDEAIARLKTKEGFNAILLNLFNITGIEVNYITTKDNAPPKKSILFKFKYGAYRPINFLSDGTIVLLAFITAIFSDISDIFFIEEPENSIHPRALYELMKLIREKSLDKQFIITTHSPYLLNMIKPEEVLVAEIQEDGLSKIDKLPNVKAIQKKLKKSFMNFGDIVFAEPETDDDSE